MPNSVEQVDGTFAYPWWILWPQFQKKIYQFTNSYSSVVVTDTKVNIFLTTDDRLLKKALLYENELQISVANPVSWLMNIAP